MKPNPIATRALAGMLPAMALFATPASAQEAAPPAAMPPPTVVVPTPSAPAVAEPAEPTANTGPSADDRAKFEASATAATGTASSAAGDAAPATETRRAPARPAARTAAPARVTRAPAPVAAAPAPVATTPVAPTAAAPAAPVAAAPLPDAPMTTPVPDAPAAAAPAATDTNTTETTTQSAGVPIWGWVLGALAILGAIAAFVGLRRRREETVWQEETVYEEPAYVEPVAAAPIAAAPVAAAPVAAAPLVHDVAVEEHAEVVTPAADEVAAITAASAPVTGRPWIELSLRPLRAGATEDSAIVDLELTLANAGEVEARDVRVSTFMLGDASEAPSDMDRLLASGHGGAEVRAGEIGAGEGSRVDATLAVPRDGLDGSTFQPIVVADVRYTLPDGSEGRTAAAFAVGVNDGTDEPTPLRLGGDMREDVEATLHGVLERA